MKWVGSKSGHGSKPDIIIAGYRAIDGKALRAQCAVVQAYEDLWIMLAQKLGLCKDSHLDIDILPAGCQHLTTAYLLNKQKLPLVQGFHNAGLLLLLLFSSR